MSILKIKGLDSTFSKKFITTWEGLIKISDDGRFSGLVVDWIIPEDTNILELNGKSKTNIIKGAFKGKSLDFTIIKNEKSIYEYKLVKLDNSYYGESFITDIKVYKGNVELDMIKPFLYSNVSLIEEKLNDINLEEEITRCLSTKDPLLNILSEKMDKYEEPTISGTFHKRAMTKSIECFKK